MPDMLLGYDVMIVPSQSESFGHVIAEAVAAAVPVMVRDVTPRTATVRDGGGAIPGNPEEWGGVIEDYARQSALVKRDRRREAVQAYVRWASEQEASDLVGALLGEGRE